MDLFSWFSFQIFEIGCLILISRLLFHAIIKIFVMSTYIQLACIYLVCLFLQAEGLSEKFLRYTRSESNETEEVKRWYWPLVKCVTVKVPDNDFLDHVTLVDLPGNGDSNRSRDQMWTEVIHRSHVMFLQSISYL